MADDSSEGVNKPNPCVDTPTNGEGGPLTASEENNTSVSPNKTVSDESVENSANSTAELQSMCERSKSSGDASTVEKETEECPPLSENSTSKPLSSENDIDQSNLHYEGDVCIYTDPASKFQYVWDGTKNEWVPKTNSEQSPDAIKEGVDVSVQENGNKANDTKDSTSSVSEKDYVFDGESYTYKDSKTGVTYKYDNNKKSWVVKDSKPSKKSNSSESESDEEDNVIRQDMTAGYYSYEGDTHLYTDPSDGSVYIWDKEKNAWFPKVDDDFLAHYQMNYGFTDPKPSSEVEEKKEDEKVEESSDLKRKLPPKEPSWFEVDELHNTKVYVSNLPLDITEQEFVDLMQKCGLVMRDVDSGKMKVKLYLDPDTNQPKGDALCTYIKIESVELALKLLDGYDFRGNKISVERAKFQMKGNYNPSLKPRKRRKKDKEKLKKMQEKLFDWRPDKLRGERSKHERTVIIKNLFDPKIFDNDVGLILEYQQDLREECSKCGNVRKVVIYDRHQEGVAQVTFREAEEADLCIKLLNGRWFGKRKLTAETWDGKAKYKIVETEEETQLRLKKWNAFLEAEDLKKKAAAAGDGLGSDSTAEPSASKTVDSEKIECTVRTEEVGSSAEGSKEVVAQCNKTEEEEEMEKEEEEMEEEEEEEAVSSSIEVKESCNTVEDKG